MKGIKLLLAVCLAPLTFGSAVADDNIDASRAAVRRAPNNSVTVMRQKSSENTSSASSQNAQTISRSTNLSAKSNNTLSEHEHTTISPRSNATTVSSSPRSQSVVTRTSVTPQVQARTASQPITSRTGAATTSRSAVTRAVGTATPRVTNTARTASTRAALSRAATKNISRAASADSAATVQNMSSNAKKCREIYYDCMDEFCANKDAVLKRCACSARTREFDSTKKNLSEVEDKMLAFNQRLLTVNMDKEDAEALYKATEGELAFNQKDTSQSKKMLDEIAKKLNTSFDDSNFDRSLSPISLSLNVDAAFDSIDSLQGAATTLKTGTELYAAALPVCREMAREVCTDDDLAIAESGYQMIIEQDCNTVAKSYQAQVDQARERVREGSALLDMSRLDIHQKRNSDDTLTCKKKMLDMLTDSSVCGSDMGKCLDVSGRYIDPSTGEAFLTENLVQINNLITRPTGDQTWTSAPGNSVFVSYLNSKKKFLEPAMENCQDIANNVWNEFLEDALAQIKLAQEAKLEDMRQSCTAITTKCLTDTAKSLSDFDARALSIFGVKADKTVTAMCSDVTNACSALLKSSGSTDGEQWVGGMTEITNANTYETILNTCREVGRACIVQVCSSTSGNFGLCESIQSSVNRKSIINRTACWNEVYNCVAEAGTDKIKDIMKQLEKTPEKNDLFADIVIKPNIPIDSIVQFPGSRSYTRNVVQGTNLNRKPSNFTPLEWSNLCDENGECKLKTFKAINDFYSEIYNLSGNKRTTTWSPTTLYIARDVPDKQDTTCTKPAETSESGTTITPAPNTDSINCIYDNCFDYCASNDGNNIDEAACYTCRITEQIWGNCESAPTAPLGEQDSHNQILKPKDDKTTLLWWFAQNTGTSNEPDSCRDTTCPAGYTSAFRPETNAEGQETGNKIWTCGTNNNVSIELELCDNAYNVTDQVINCCPTNNEEIHDEFKNCLPTETINAPKTNKPHFKTNGVIVNGKKLYLPAANKVVATWELKDAATASCGDNTCKYPAGNYALICAGADDTGAEDKSDAVYPNGKTITCSGKYVVVNLDTGLYFTPGNPEAQTNMIDASDTNGTQCHYSLTTNASWKTDKDEICPINDQEIKNMNWKVNITY